MVYTISLLSPEPWDRRFGRGSQAFVDGGWHGRQRGEWWYQVPQTSGHLKERPRESQKLHSFPPHLGCNNCPSQWAGGYWVGLPPSLSHSAHGGAWQGWVPRIIHPQWSCKESPGTGGGQPAITEGQRWGSSPRGGAWPWLHTQGARAPVHPDATQQITTQRLLCGKHRFRPRGNNRKILHVWKTDAINTAKTEEANPMVIPYCYTDTWMQEVLRIHSPKFATWAALGTCFTPTQPFNKINTFDENRKKTPYLSVRICSVIFFFIFLEKWEMISLAATEKRLLLFPAVLGVW